MAQPTFPGVFIREVSSGARSITGVATSITAFIGMSKTGPMTEPTRVLGFTDYTRIFSADTSQGEMTDQVRQFFQNGGQQAFIVRIAEGATAATLDLEGTSGNPVISLEAKSPGQDGMFLKARVDYNTASPERTFNLTLFRETVDTSGNPRVEATEVHKELSLRSTDARYVATVLEEESALAAVDTVTLGTGTSGYSASGRFYPAGTLFSDFAASITATGKAAFRVRVGGGLTQIISITTTLTNNTDLLSAINGPLTDATATIEAVTGLGEFLKITATATDDDVVVDPASDGDITTTIGFGLGSGGVEVGAFASQRPVPSGYVSVIQYPNLTALTAFAKFLKADVDGLEMTGAAPFQVPTAADIPYPLATGSMATGTIVTAAPALALANVRQNLQAMATAINGRTNDWRAEVHGFRLALLPVFDASGAGPGHSFNSNGTSLIASAGLIFDSAAGFDSVARASANTLVGGSDGEAPTQAQYNDAFDALDEKVDIFNIIVLPKSKDHTPPRPRSAIWGFASGRAEDSGAFLLVDAEAKSVNTMAQEILSLRAGVEKDFSAVYWPRLKVSTPEGLKTIDTSGSVAGIMSRIDSSRGVWKAPAGLEATVRGTLAVEVPMSDPQNGVLNPLAVNAIRVFPAGIVVWGARTMNGFDNSGDDDFKYVPVRRLTLFIEESVRRGLQFAVFEPNDERLWSQIRLAVTGFLNGLFRQGAFFGKTARDAFFVKVDAETTTPTDISLGIVNVVVGFAPVKPAEFIIVTIQQKAGQVQV